MEALAGRVAVVTGAASGIGRALAARLAREGMTVVLAGLPGKRLDAAVRALGDGGGHVHGVGFDVSDADATEAAALSIEEALGGIDLVCLNAGVLGPTNIPLWEIDQRDWQWVLGVNLWGVVNGIRAFVPRLLKSDDAHVVITGSVAGLVTGNGEAPYVISKHAVVALAEILQRQLAGTPVGVTVLCPWWVRTNILSTTRNRGTENNSPLAEHKELRDAGMAPADLADLTLAAILESRLYVHTHPDSIRDALTSRFTAILDSAAGSRPKKSAPRGDFLQYGRRETSADAVR